jgi:hypothetical protein
MLSGMGFYQDILSGEDNQQTRNAVMRLQTELGLEPTGTIDDDLYALASYGALGTARYVAIMSRDIYGTLDPATAAHHYGSSERPAEEVRFREELAALAQDQQVRAVAAAISAIDGGFCTMPAMSAELDGDKWIVGCAEGKFALTFTGYDMSVTPIEDAPAPPPTPPPGKDKSPSPRGKDKG